MIPKDNYRISILDKLHISTEEIIMYLESINIANSQIISVLKKKPSLPGYEKLPWVIESKIYLTITSKLKNRQKLSIMEKNKLRETLASAAASLKKIRRPIGTPGRLKGLESYIQKLL